MAAQVKDKYKNEITLAVSKEELIKIINDICIRHTKDKVKDLVNLYENLKRDCDVLNDDIKVLRKRDREHIRLIKKKRLEIELLEKKLKRKGG